MKIQKALRPTGKAIDKRNRDAHIEVRFECGANYLVWINNKTGDYEGKLSYEAHFTEDWQPYTEVKEISPENINEVWINKTGQPLITYAHGMAHDQGLGDLRITMGAGVVCFLADLDEIIHGKNGWTRVEPPVEDENVETIEIEGIVWQDSALSEAVTPRGTKLGDFVRKHKLSDKPPMKMILKMQKEAT